MSVIKSLEVWPKKNEPGAYMVKIGKVDFSKTIKWFRGEKTRPSRFLSLSKEDFRRICDLIDRVHESGEKETWHIGEFKKCAYAHQKKSEAAGAC